ncbi:MAG: alpha/beta fold hydrolase [Alphaproteobacteria bacterium]|nr:alpha/beta fold hydrolase [Alphaproteobacteria bacterium]
MHKLLMAICGIFLLFSFMGKAMASEEKTDLVVLLHGIGHSEWNMAGVEFALKQAGYQTLNIGYPSRQKNLTALADFLNAELQNKAVWSAGYSKVHFTTHSMGGLVVRTYLNDHQKEIDQSKLGRVVMLAPPNGGSEVADLLKDFLPYQWIYGPAGQELTTEKQAKMKAEVYYDLGIIAGNKEWPYIIAAHIIPNESDGRVALTKTKLKGMADHVTLSVTHSFISWKPSVHKQIIYFLNHGTFKHDD